MPNADLLLVTVTKTETRAVLQCFREATGQDAVPQVLGDKTYHALGTVNACSVWLVQSEMGAAGLGASLQTVQKSLETLRPGAVVMVGIAFGVDNKKQSLGDILVARQLMMYEPQRIGQEAVVPRGPRVDCSPRLLDRCRNADIHWEGAPVRFGLMLSGEKLVDNVAFRQALLQHEPEAIGGEMEGAGLYGACHDARVDWLLVKAICDWADGDKGTDKANRQATAARNAAQFVLHTLQTIGLKLEGVTRAEREHDTSTQADRRALEARVGLDLVEVAAQDGGVSVGGNVGGDVHIYNGPPPAAAPAAAPTAAPTPSTLPAQPYFFGREAELERIANALQPATRAWGALIDGPGGIGKTALAIRAAHLAPAPVFARKIFITAKVRELTPDGERALTDFTRSSYLAMLDELSQALGQDTLARLAPDERPNALRHALAGQRALIIFDNLETLPEAERVRLFQFLSLLPEGNKAIVTSRRRDDVDARIVRLDRLAREAAMQLMAELALKYPRLNHATEKERDDLYTLTQGNPLFIRWVAGQLGRSASACRTLAEACAFLAKAPPGNDPLEYIFGDLLTTFTEAETHVLAALTYFTQPAQLQWLVQMTNLPERAAITALEDLTDRSILITNYQSPITYLLPPLASQFIKTRRPQAVAQTGDTLVNRAFALALQYGGYANYKGFRTLEAEWAFIAAALPGLLSGDNARLQTVCGQLDKFLDFTGKWDELVWLHEQAEARALAAGDKEHAGWRAYQAGWVYHLRNQPTEVLACAARAAAHWQTSTPRNQAATIQLRGLGHQLNQDYSAAITAHREALEIHRALAPESDDVAIELNWLAGAERARQDYAAAEGHYREALRIAKKIGLQEQIAEIVGNLASLALDREQWAEAEALAREALELAEKVGRLELIAADCHFLAQALLKQGLALSAVEGRDLAEAEALARRAVEIFKRLKSPKLAEAQALLEEIEGASGGKEGK